MGWREPMAENGKGLSTFDERLLQGVFARVWRHLGEMDDTSKLISNSPEPEQLRAKLNLAVGREGVDIETMLADIDGYLEDAVKTSHPNFMQPLWGGTSVPAFAGEILTALTNTSMYTFEMAPVASLIEAEIIDTMSTLAGFEAGEGTFTTGGSNGNLLGLLCARDRKLPDSRREGLSGKQLVAFVSEESHYSVEMAVNVLGVGLNNLIVIECDAGGRLVPDALAEAIAAEKRAGKQPFCVIATSGTTVRGAFDPLHEIADICHAEHLWLHVDASWGGAALLSPKTRGLLRGIERADSIAWDPHKMMGIQIICSVFLVRDKGTLRRVCRHGESGHYLLHDDSSEIDLGRMSLQCGRRVDAVKLWLAWRALGHEGWAKRIERFLELSEILEARVREHPQLEMASEREFANICMRFIGFGLSDAAADSVTDRIRDEIMLRGRFMVTKALLDGRPIIRPVIANPLVDEAVLESLLKEIVEVGNDLSA
jgi:glutamate/tyrosine decarboxylase-like PLP-dependent enzyme